MFLSEKTFTTFFYVFFFIFSDLILPFYNKTIFSLLVISKEKDALSYPTSITFIQVFTVAMFMIAFLLFVNILKYIIFDFIGSWLNTFARKRGILWYKNLEGQNNDGNLNASGSKRNSKILKSHNSFDELENFWEENKISNVLLFFMKIKELTVVSFAFACVITLSNIGLSKTGLNIHILLRATTSFWVVLLSFFLKNEKPTLLQIVFTLFIVSGATIISFKSAIDSWTINKDQIIGIIVNLVSAFCSGLQAVSLRSSVQKVKLPPYNMSLLEITAFKLSISSAFIIIPALLFDVAIARPMFFEVFTKSAKIAIPFIIGGVIVTGMYQGSVVAVTSRLQALTVSLIHQMIFLPQLILYTIIDFSGILKDAKIDIFTYSIPSIIGAILIVIGSVGYTGYRWYIDWKKRRNEELNALEETHPILSNQAINSV